MQSSVNGNYARLMSTTLMDRALRPARLVPRKTAGGDVACPVTSFFLLLAAVSLQLVLSANTLALLGIPYSKPGGNPLVKFHPATYLAALALLLLLHGTGGPIKQFAAHLDGRLRLATFFAMMTICIIYLAVTTGTSGSAVYVESYLSAGLVACVMGRCNDRQRRIVGCLLITLFVVNVCISIVESLLQTHFLPVPIPEGAGDFRGFGLYNHPLTGAAMTMMGVMLVLGAGFRPRSTAVLVAVLVIGLLSFGGRTAFITTGVTLLGLLLFHNGKDLLHRRVGLTNLAVLLFALIVAPILIGIILSTTEIGARMIDHFYLDDSARVREVEWYIPDLMNRQQLLFGTDTDDLLSLELKLGMSPPNNDIENFWLLTFVNLGAVGCAFYLVGLWSFLRHLWSVSIPYGRLLLIMMMLDSSASNSLARKSNVLFILVACLFALVGFAARPGNRRVSLLGPPAERTVPQRAGLRMDRGPLIEASNSRT
jgi:hypothetical protein